jgi:hypothetical protein
MISEDKYLKRVLLTSDVYAACLQHALTTEKEEVMGLLIGEVIPRAHKKFQCNCQIIGRREEMHLSDISVRDFAPQRQTTRPGGNLAGTTVHSVRIRRRVGTQVG